MTCQESAATTAVRILVLGIQGVLRSLVDFSLSVLLVPVWSVAIPLATAVRSHHSPFAWMLLLPVWVIAGVGEAFARPFIIGAKSLGDTATIARIEWGLRGRTGTYLNPDGTPLDDILDPMEKRLIDDYVTARTYSDFKNEIK